MSAREYLSLASRALKAVRDLTAAIEGHTAALNRASDLREEEG